MRELLIARMAAVARHVLHFVFGLVVATAPTETVVRQVQWGAYVWAGLFVVGGAVGAYGALRRRWVMERWAIWPESVAWAVYIGSLVFRWATGGGMAVLAVALALTIIVLSLVVRYGELTAIARASARREAQ